MNKVIVQSDEGFSNLPTKIVPRPSGLRQYPPGSLDLLLDIRMNSLKGIFIQSPIIGWEIPLFQRPQHMAIAMAKLGYLVFYISPSHTNDEVDGFIEVYPNLFITNDDQIPFQIKNSLISVYSTLAYYTHDQFKKIKQNNKILYEYIDHIDPQISGDSVPLLLKQFDFFNDNKNVDFIAISGKQLFKDMSESINKRKLLYVPNGVEFEHYESSIANSYKYPTPTDLIEITKKNKPIVGYFGALAPWLWYEMLDELIHEMPDYEFVFIGPDYYGGAERLPKLENCHNLGAIDYKMLPQYAVHFHVTIIPFEPGPIARTTSPLKLFEYFALQKPVVVTSDMVECVAFKEVLAGSDTKSFKNAIRNAYKNDSNKNLKKVLRQRAIENSWDERAKVISNEFLKN